MDSITTMPMSRMLWDLGEMMIEDDKHDIGYFAYRNRKYHTYHGRRAPNHPLPFHHWQIGGIFCIVGKLAAMIELAKETEADFSEPIIMPDYVRIERLVPIPTQTHFPSIEVCGIRI